MQGRHDEAVAQFERVIALANDVGLLSEEYNVPGKHLAGNFPQALTHLALVNTALGLSGPSSQPRGRLSGSRDLLQRYEAAMADDHYDVIVIGSGPGGGSLAHRLAPTGKRILMLERGDYLPRSRANWDAKTVFVDGAYQATDTWYGKDGQSFRPGLHYCVGGNSKVYGAALFRLRERDFGDVAAYRRRLAGLAARLRRVRALLQPGRSAVPRPRPARRRPDRALVQHALRLSAGQPRAAHPGAQRQPGKGGPASVPSAARHPAGREGREGHATPTPCIRCDAFDGFPCAINAKADAQVICVDPTLKQHDNFTLLTGAYVSRLETDASGGTVSQGACHAQRRARGSIPPTSWSSPAAR